MLPIHFQYSKTHSTFYLKIVFLPFKDRHCRACHGYCAGGERVRNMGGIGVWVLLVGRGPLLNLHLALLFPWSRDLLESLKIRKMDHIGLDPSCFPRSLPPQATVSGNSLVGLDFMSSWNGDISLMSVPSCSVHKRSETTSTWSVL